MIAMTLQKESIHCPIMIFLFIIQYLKILPYVHRFELKFYLKRWQRLWKEFSSVTGLPNPGEDQSDEDLVESVLKLANIPEASVRRAVRLPMRTRDLKSLVLVELDTKSHQKEVLDNRSLIRSSPALSVLFKLVKTIVALLVSSMFFCFPGAYTANPSTMPPSKSVSGEQDIRNSGNTYKICSP